MPDETKSIARRRRLSVDTWAVLLAIVLALLVRFAVIRTVPW